MYDFILVDRNALRVGVVTLNRPEHLNAWHTAMRHELITALDSLNADDAIKAIIITGAGDRAFCAGQDLNETKSYDDTQADGWMNEWDALYGALRRMDKPTIAALNGLAVGSAFQFALLCDIRVAHAGVRLGQPEIDAGIPSITGAWVIQNAVSYARTVEMILTGRLVDADECLRIGLVHHLVDEGDVLSKSLEIANDLSAKPPVAMKLNKRRLREITEPAFRDAMDSGHAYHREAFASGEPQAQMEKFFATRASRRTDEPLEKVSK